MSFFAPLSEITQLLEWASEEASPYEECEITHELAVEIAVQLGWREETSGSASMPLSRAVPPNEP